MHLGPRLRTSCPSAGWPEGETIPANLRGARYAEAMTLYQIALVVGFLLTVVAAIYLHFVAKRFEKLSSYKEADEDPK